MDRPRPICPRCKEFGIHANDEDCLNELRAEIDRLRQQVAMLAEPSVKALGHYEHGFTG